MTNGKGFALFFGRFDPDIQTEYHKMMDEEYAIDVAARYAANEVKLKEMRRGLYRESQDGIERDADFMLKHTVLSLVALHDLHAMLDAPLIAIVGADRDAVISWLKGRIPELERMANWSAAKYIQKRAGQA